MEFYAKIKNEKVTQVLRAEKQPVGAVLCNKPIYINGQRYVGKIPKVGYVYDGQVFKNKKS